MPCHRQLRVGQDRAGHGECVDRVGFAAFAARGAGPRHQLGGHPHHALTGVGEVAFESRGGGTGVFHTPQQVGAVGVAGPAQRGEMSLWCRGNGHGAEFPAAGIDGDHRVRPFVGVDPDDGHRMVARRPVERRRAPGAGNTCEAVVVQHIS